MQKLYSPIETIDRVRSLWRAKNEEGEGDECVGYLSNYHRISLSAISKLLLCVWLSEEKTIWKSWPGIRFIRIQSRVVTWSHERIHIDHNLWRWSSFGCESLRVYPTYSNAAKTQHLSWGTLNMKQYFPLSHIDWIVFWWGQAKWVKSAYFTVVEIGSNRFTTIALQRTFSYHTDAYIHSFEKHKHRHKQSVHYCYGYAVVVFTIVAPTTNCIVHTINMRTRSEHLNVDACIKLLHDLIHISLYVCVCIE